MRIYNTALKLARFIHITLRKNVLNLQKNLPLYLRKNFLTTAGNLKLNEQSKYKSVQFFLFLDIERKPEIWDY